MIHRKLRVETNWQPLVGKGETNDIWHHFAFTMHAKHTVCKTVCKLAYCERHLDGFCHQQGCNIVGTSVLVVANRSYLGGRGVIRYSVLNAERV